MPFADINGCKMYYEVAGSGDTTVVFSHAGVADHRLWDDQFEWFSKKYQVVRYDMRGYGKTEPVDGEFSRTEDLLALIQHLGIKRAALVGCSMGGGFSMNVALDHPELVAALVMVCSGPPGLDLDAPDATLEALFEQASAAFKAGDIPLTAELETQIWFDGGKRTAADVDPVIRAKALEMNLTALQHEAKGLGTQKSPPTPTASERLAELQMPVLVIVGALDEPYSLAAADVMVERIKNARKVVIDNTAHFPSIEHPQTFNQILTEFFNSVL